MSIWTVGWPSEVKTDKSVTPRTVDAYRAHARAVADRLLDRATAKGEFDWVHDVCEMMPIRVFIDVFGAPEAGPSVRRRVGF